MAISFNTIPVDLRVPGAYVEIDNSRALRGLVGMPRKVLLIGPRLDSGTVPAGTPVQVLTERAAQGYFGRGSILHLMFRAFKAGNDYTEVWGIGLDDDDAAQAASGSIAVSGPATAGGTIALMIDGARVRVGVAAGDAPAAIATAIAAAINAQTDLPLSAAVNGVDDAQVDLTARNAGETGNHIDVRHSYHTGEALPAGVGLAVTALSGGTANPDVADAVAAMGDEWWTDVVIPWTDAANLAALEAEAARRFEGMDMRDMFIWAGASGTHADLTTLGNSRNSPHLSILGAGASPSGPWAWAAALAAVASYHLQIDPARPLQTLVLDGLLPPAVEERFDLTERNLLLHDGVATHKVDAGGRVLVERAVTTYEVDAGGIEDASYLDVTTLATVAYLRYSLRARITQKFPRHKLASNGTAYGAGQAIVTPDVIRAELVALFKDWEDAGLVEGFDQFKRDLIVERNANDPNRVDAVIPPDVVNQLRIFAGKIEFRL
ncbi:phage tail sheath subtilisin-like domain-containing protein [Roseospirillum parvum]|uniref:Mu-like prophage tail sheath protein gpL n=1 Tax=Roseospirillum parvum TaxID=83401 RepID=A0A1G8G2K4_9PROT|nr:phage tail sheath subtilisin-like domain-containing protein [Roseospirillum parvum]SDH88648.1 Mu-like prophage tail sheath protein gpL [Roseospirillum parvum]